MKKLTVWLLCCILLVGTVSIGFGEVGTYREGKSTYTGGLQDGKPCGLGVKTYTSGAISVGVFAPSGRAYGFAVTADPKSATYYYHLSAGFQEDSSSMKMLDKFDYTDSKKHRICFTDSVERGQDKRVFDTYKSSKGNVFYGETVDGLPCGYGIYVMKDGSCQAGNFVSGKLNGRGILLRADGSGYVGQFTNHQLNGYAYYFDKSGTAYLVEYKNNTFIEKLNDGKALTSAQTSLPPDQLVSRLATNGLNTATGGGTTSNYEAPKKTQCARCNGSGRVTCTHCGGIGYTYSTYHVNADGTRVRERLDCGSCLFGKMQCPSCHGTGKQ